MMNLKKCSECSRDMLAFIHKNSESTMYQCRCCGTEEIYLRVPIKDNRCQLCNTPGALDHYMSDSTKSVYQCGTCYKLNYVKRG